VFAVVHIVNALTTIPIIANFLAVLIVLAACKILHPAARRGQSDGALEARSAKNSANDEIKLQEMTNVSAEIDDLARLNKELEAKLLQAKQENVKLKNQRRIMKQNIQHYKETAEAVRKAENKLRKERSGKGKRTGKKPGSAGGGFVRPDETDYIKHWRLHKCPRCGESLAGCNPVSSWEHVIIDVQRPRNKRGMLWKTTKHVMYRYRCPGCGKIVAKDLGMYKHLHYGIGLISFVLQLRSVGHNSWEDIMNVASYVFGKEYMPTVQACIEWVKDLEPITKIVHDAFVEVIKKSPVTNSDETGMPMDTKNRWLWILATAHVILFLPSDSRGHETVQDIFEGYKGVVVADFWSAYNKLNVEQQKCLAHVIQDLKKIEHVASEESAKGRAKLAKDASIADESAAGDVATDDEDETLEAAASSPKKRGRKPKPVEPLSPEGRAAIEANVEQNNKVFAQIEKLLAFFRQAWGDGEMGWKAPIEKRITIDEAVQRMFDLIETLRSEGVANAAIERIVKRFEKFAPSMFTYLEHDGVPPDNNGAERPLRHFVAQRKVSGNFVNREVMDVYAVLLSLAKTCQLNDVPFENVLAPLLKDDVQAVFQQLGLPFSPPHPADDPPSRLDGPGA